MTILRNEGAGSASPQQIERLRKAAEESRLRGHYSWLLGLAQVERDTHRREPRTADLPKLTGLDDLSRYEASDLIAKLERNDRDELRVCLRCARLGFVQEFPCVHDRSNFDQSRTAAIVGDGR